VAARYVEKFLSLFELLPENANIFPAWQLVLQHRLSGIRVHDARIAAISMISNGTGF